MAQQQLINGKCYDWADITISFSGLENIEPTEISYDDEEEAELIYGKGGKPRGYGTGNQKNSFKLSLSREDYNAICAAAKKQQVSFYRFIIPKITVSFANEGSGTCTDVLMGCKFNKRSFKSANGDKNEKVDLDGFCYKGIKSNGLEA